MERDIDLPLPPLPPVDTTEPIRCYYLPPPPPPLPDEEEQWKLVDSGYEVSNLGHVRRYRCITFLGLQGQPRFKKVDGRRTVHLLCDGYSKREFVDELVARAFVANPDDGTQVEHINGDLLDDRAINLRWVKGPPRNAIASLSNTLGGSPIPSTSEGTARRPVDLVERKKEERQTTNAMKPITSKRKEWRGRPPRPIERITSTGDIIQRYPSITAASNDTGLSLNLIIAAAQGKIRAAKGTYWRYVDKTT